jgi:2-iminobutanoate/2-iminopropanoate deaminase
MKLPVISQKAPAPIGPYSQAIEVGEFVFCSGQIGLDPKTGKLVEGIVAQTKMALTNLSEVLVMAGLNLTDVVKTTVFMADLSEFQKMNEEYAKHFPDIPPARSTVQAGLPRGARIEIEAIAFKRAS